MITKKEVEEIKSALKEIKDKGIRKTTISIEQVAKKLKVKLK